MHLIEVTFAAAPEAPLILCLFSRLSDSFLYKQCLIFILYQICACSLSPQQAQIKFCTFFFPLVCAAHLFIWVFDYACALSKLQMAAPTGMARHHGLLDTGRLECLAPISPRYILCRTFEYLFLYCPVFKVEFNTL